jgi:hypothetical protein
MKKKESITPQAFLAYITGTLRHKLWYSRFKFLIPEHIQEQFLFRVRFIDIECYSNGSCKLCGCHTLALQFANKSCDKPCYPKMMSKAKWKRFLTGDYRFEDKTGIWSYIPSAGARKEQITCWTDGKGILRYVANNNLKP